MGMTDNLTSLLPSLVKILYSLSGRFKCVKRETGKVSLKFSTNYTCASVYSRVSNIIGSNYYYYYYCR